MDDKQEGCVNIEKMITIVTALALIVGVGSALAYKELNGPSDHSPALAKTFKSTEEIVKDSKVIIKGNVPKEYRKETVGEIVFLFMMFRSIRFIATSLIKKSLKVKLLRFIALSVLTPMKEKTW